MENLGLDFNITFVVYVGVGCGAGWATTYNKQLAILLGLENIAEEKWHTQQKLKGLIAHKIGHLISYEMRNEWIAFEEAEHDPIFQLYSEGFAQRCENTILEKETWHLAENKKWPSWCQQHKKEISELASSRIS